MSKNLYVDDVEVAARPSRWKRSRSLAWFLAWFATGALLELSFLGALTIGIFVLPIAIGLTVLLAKRRGSTDGIAGLISGLALPLLYVAYLNRDGPGDICTTSSGGGQTCTQELSPWPWLLLGVALVVLGAVVFIRSARKRAEMTS